jgi:hypothetical protein
MEDRPSFGNAGAGDGSVHKRCMKAMEDPVSKEYYLVLSLYLREWSRSADETSSFYFGVDASSTMRVRTTSYNCAFKSCFILSSAESFGECFLLVSGCN